VFNLSTLSAAQAQTTDLQETISISISQLVKPNTHIPAKNSQWNI